MKTGSKKRGFSLAEVLVSVAIIAVIAAVVIPSFASQLNKGDDGRVESDLVNIRSSIEQFLADVRRYPATIQQVIAKPTVTDTGAVGGTYSTAQLARWRGPYIMKDSASTVATGYGVKIFTLLRAENPPGFLPSTQKFLTILIPGMDSISALSLDVAMDDGVLTTGSLRWLTTGVDTLKFFAIPIQ